MNLRRPASSSARARIGVTDGDTITVLDAEKTQFKIRLNGIDAPESHQAFGQRSKQALSSKVFGKLARIEPHGQDRYGRTIGDVFVDDRYINQEMIQDGWAWHYLKYSDSAELADAEAEARRSSFGLWADANAIAPWEFRQPATIPTSFASAQTELAAAESTVYITKSGTKYHAGGCRYLSKSKIAIPLSRAKAGYSPCSVCGPPE